MSNKGIGPCRWPVSTPTKQPLESIWKPFYGRTGPVCPHCQNADPERIHRLQGKSTRPGLLKCRECEKPFSVTVGTVFERSKECRSQSVGLCHPPSDGLKKGISSHQLSRMLGVSYKTAWFMTHRIREAMRPAELTPMGGEGAVIEADETFCRKT